MHIPLDPGDQRLLIGTGLALLLLTIASLLMVPADSGAALGVPSSYSPESAGAKAAFLLLRQLGYEVDRWEKPATLLPIDPEPTVLILADPFLPSTREDRQTLARFLRNGGRVLATGSGAAQLLPEAMAAPTGLMGLRWETFPAKAPSPLMAGPAKVTLAPLASWKMDRPGHIAVYGDEEQNVVVTYRHGLGKIVWWAAATPLTNAGIRREENLALLLNSVGGPAQTRILWDEYYHGRTGSLWSYLAATPLIWGLAQAALFALAVLLTFARRSGPVCPRVKRSRLSPLEFVDALGDLYCKAGIASAAVHTAFDRFRYLLAQQSGASPTADANELYEVARRRIHRHDRELLRLLQRCEVVRETPEVTGTEATYLVRGLQEYAKILRLAKREVRT